MVELVDTGAERSPSKRVQVRPGALRIRGQHGIELRNDSERPVHNLGRQGGVAGIEVELA